MGIKELQAQIKSLALADTKRLEAQTVTLGEIANISQKIYAKILPQLLPMIQTMLTSDYNVGVISGDLMKAVKNSIVKLNRKNEIYITLQPEQDVKVYIRANAFKRYKGFYTLSPAQIQTLQTEFSRLFKLELQSLVNSSKGA